VPIPLHHAAICARDLDASLRFYRDGLGLEVMMDQEFSGDWLTLFHARGDRLHSIFLGDPGSADAGVVELVAFDAGIADGRPPSTEPALGFFLLSFFVTDLDAVLARLAELGFGDDPSCIEVPGPLDPVAMATVRDPDGVLVELIGTSSQSTTS
jgi:glyoxylase I family protein